MQGLGSPLGETLLVVWQLLYSWPRLGRGRAKQAENLENLINLLQRNIHTSGLAAQGSWVRSNSWMIFLPCNVHMKYPQSVS